MKAFLALTTTTTLIAALATGCATTCIEGANGGMTCTAKSLIRFDGAVPPLQVFDRTPGAPLTIDVQYGNVLVGKSNSGKVEVEFHPYCYAGNDEQAAAQQMMAQNLRTTATAAGAVTVSVTRAGGSNGLGADVVVRVPESFDGPLTVVNRGDGPLNNFDLKIDYVGRANALAATNQSVLGNCWIQGGPSVGNTTVQCAETISVFDVSGQVNITNTETRHDPSSPAITLRMAQVGGAGGKVVATSGAIAATFPRAGGYVLDARSPVKGMVQEGALPPGCQTQAASPAQKTIRCGNGPTYQLIAGAQPDYIGKPEDSNVMLSYQ
jgi:hypothetical protein